jgi:hypothetical protein
MTPYRPVDIRTHFEGTYFSVFSVEVPIKQKNSRKYATTIAGLYPTSFLHGFFFFFFLSPDVSGRNSPRKIGLLNYTALQPKDGILQKRINLRFR